jgi:hypothetical protein
MPIDTENVFLSGQTGIGRRTVRAAPPGRAVLLVDSGHDLCPARGNCSLLRSHAPAPSHKITELGESQTLTIYGRHLIWSDETRAIGGAFMIRNIGLAALLVLALPIGGTAAQSLQQLQWQQLEQQQQLQRLQQQQILQQQLQQEQSQSQQQQQLLQQLQLQQIQEDQRLQQQRLLLQQQQQQH